MLEEYHDKQIIQFLKFGWPISQDGRKYSDLNCDNWKGAKLNPVQVSKYLLNEIEFKSVIGPFHRNPFIQKAGILPLNTRDKKDSQEKRIILDLSFPEGATVNDGIDKTVYLGVRIQWDLPTVDNLAILMVAKGIGSLLFKHDLKRYYKFS